MTMTNKDECVICSKIVNECDVPEETLIELLDLIFIEQLQELSGTSKPKICKICLDKMFEIFNFKSRCVYIEDMLIPYIEKNNFDLNLKAIGESENMFDGSKCDTETICRLCFKPILKDEISLEDVLQQKGFQELFDKNLSEVNLNVVTKAYICKVCLLSLQKYCYMVQYSPQAKIEKGKCASANNEDTNSSDCVNNTEKKGDGIFQCEKCPFITVYKRSLQSHMDIHDKRKLFKCTECSKQVKTAGSLRRHVKLHSPLVERFFCNQCDYHTRSKNYLASHILRHADNGEWFECSKCTYKSRVKQKLARHMMLHDNKPKKFTCNICEYKTNYKENLKKHIVIHEDNAPIYSCDQCDYKTKHKGYMKYHKVKHDESSKLRKYKCSICNYETIYSGNLMKQHMKTHSKTSKDFETYQCDKCDFKTQYKAHLKNHDKVHKDYGEVETFYCDICPFKTKHKTSIRNHTTNHLKNS